MKNLETVLSHYGVKGKVIKTNDGPIIRQIVFKPGTGTKLKNISASIKDIQRELQVSSLRVQNIDGTDNIGFEVPRENPQTVYLADIFKSKAFEGLAQDLPIYIGAGITGDAVIEDLSKMPHLLVAGATGSGKSVGLNTFILSLIKTKKPKDLKFVLIDPKRIEFTLYNDQEYMLMPVVTENKNAAEALKFLVGEMEKRYGLFEQNLCKNIKDYQRKIGEMPYIVCVIDEFSDLILYDKNIQGYLQNLAQKARACGIHIILATQRPSTDVMTGVIKANFPTRLSYKVSSSIDSRIILDMAGAEDLIGRGDSLFLKSNGDLIRTQGAFMPDEEIEKMLVPYRMKVKPIRLDEAKETDGEGKSWFKTGLDTWNSLSKREKNTLIAGAGWLGGIIMGKLKSKKKK